MRRTSGHVFVAIAVSASLMGSSLLTALPVSAAATIVSAQSQHDIEVLVAVDGELLDFEQPAMLDAGTTFVPMRGVFEALGASIKWDNPTRTVTATEGETTIRITVDSQEAVINNRTVQLEKPARVVNGSTMVPLRFVAEALGAKVDWKAERYLASIRSRAYLRANSPVIAKFDAIQLKRIADPSESNRGKPSYVEGLAPLTFTSTLQSAWMETLYANRTYGIELQADYNQVMLTALEALTERMSEPLPTDLVSFLYEGQRGDPNKLDLANMELLAWEQKLSGLLEQGVSFDGIIQFMAARSIIYQVAEKHSDLMNFSYSSALVSDLLGYNSAIVGYSGATSGGGYQLRPYIQVEGKWFDVTYRKYTADDIWTYVDENEHAIFWLEPTNK